MAYEPAARHHGPGAGDRRPRRGVGPALSLAAAITTLVAACGGASLPAPAETVGPTPPATTLAPSTTAQAAVPTAAASADAPDPLAASGPPAAVAGDFPDPSERRIAGALGTWSWDDAGSDAPWIVPTTGGRVAPAAALEVAFDPPLEPATWIARWARVEDAGAGSTLEAVEGTGPVVISAPAGAGTWSLQLDARFAQGRGAAWYWRMEVEP